MGYTILELENLPESLKKKPRWVSCMVFTAAVLIVTVSAVSVGVLLGYTYCYIEHRSVKTGNVTQSTSLQIVQMSNPDTEESRRNRTINGAIMSNVIMSRILKIGHALMDDDMSCIPISGDEYSINTGL